MNRHVAWGLLGGLWVLLLLPPYLMRASSASAVQIQIHARLAGRLARLSLVEKGPAAPLGPSFLAEARELVDEALAHRPGDSGLLARRALLLLAGGQVEAARQALPENSSDPLIAALRALWDEPAREGLEAILEEHLDGFYLYQARHFRASRSGDLARVEALEGAERARAQVEARWLGWGAGLGALNLLLGFLALACWPFCGRRLAGPIPARIPPRNFSLLGVAAVVVGFQFLNTVPASLAAGVMRALGIPRIPTVVLIQVGVYGATAGLVAWFLGHGGRRPRAADAGLGPGRPARWLALGLMGYWMALPLVLLAHLATYRLLGRPPFSNNPVLEMLASASPGELLALGLVVVLLGPLVEEVIFRGLVYAGLRQRMGGVPAAILSGLLFAGIHGDPQGILILATLGCLFAFLYERTGSVWPAAAAHGLWNGSVTALLVAVLHTPA